MKSDTGMLVEKTKVNGKTIVMELGKFLTVIKKIVK